MHRPVATVLTLALVLAPVFAHAGEQAEAAAADLLQKRMQTRRPEDLALLEAVADKDVVVVAGSMDHIQDVLRHAGIPHTVVGPGRIAQVELRNDQIVMVNCPGRIPEAGVKRIERFVRAGGLLYTTDWALKNLVQKAFPRTIRHNGHSTGDHVTRVQVHAKGDDLMSDILLRGKTEPQWWLEGGSYPIKIVDEERVQVIASSKQMKRRYKSAPVVVRFRWHDGEVIHVVSHFYRQVQTQGPRVAAKKSMSDVGGLTKEQKADFSRSAGGEVDMNEVESSYAFQQMTANVVVDKQKKNEKLADDYDKAATGDITLEGEKVRRGAKLKVLGPAADGRVRVRDTRGYEDEVPAALVE